MNFLWRKYIYSFYSKSRWSKAIISNFGKHFLWDMNSHEIFHSKMKFLDKVRVQSQLFVVFRLAIIKAFSETST